MTTGAGGMLGQAVAVAAAAAGDELIETDRAALDIT
ncbi:MAG: dTDP-4-dehydrorhamnose reductase, partial [Actinobacteria bacterium]|nr:dTDP-4-dehydrorhamnose reductase [Actinomycetota bacterium]